MESGRREYDSIEIAQDEIVLVESKKVAELVEVGGADFLGKDLGIPLGQVPEVLKVEDDAGRRIGGGRVGFEPAGALKQSEEIGLEPLVEDGWVRNILIKGDHRFGGQAELGGKAGADFFNAGPGELM